jgi:23S rRNA (cytidine2498-2'-O)-methyltransferase
LKSELKVPIWSTALPENPFIRARGHALERIEGKEADELIAKIIDKYAPLDWTDLHIWQRDIAVPGWHGFEPGRSALVELVAERIQSRLVEAQDSRADRINRIAEWKAKILDVALIEPNQWWVGGHLAESVSDRWPGGVFPITEPENMISRAYLKIAEAIQWSRMPMKTADHVVEIGSSPGGACRYLLDMGLNVVGIDPAEMDESVLQHPNFEHLRLRSLQVKRKFFSKFRWLVCDANVAPSYTLETVEAIVTYPTSQIEGLILTMKLSDWERASEWQDHVERVRSWGYSKVAARQLAFNRREYCIAAQR